MATRGCCIEFIAKFPIYSLTYCEKSKQIVVGGGGGPSKSGIKNGLVRGQSKFISKLTFCIGYLVY